MKQNGKKYFILLSTCKVVKGAKRSLLIDYAHDIVYYIGNDFYDLILDLKHKDIETSFNELEDNQSKRNFEDFIVKMVNNKMAILTENPKCYPPLSQKINDENILFQDTIIELDEKNFKSKTFQTICEKLSAIYCVEWQIRLLSPLNIEFLNNILNKIRQTETLYLEIHIENQNLVTQQDIEKIIEEYPFLSNIYIYNCGENKKINVLSNGKIPVSYGSIIYLNYPFNKGNCCGTICKENLDFTDFYVNIRLQKTNGCLYKKICFDIYGNIKNCPSMYKTFGNIEEINLNQLINNKEFTKLWYITKDEIQICKDCEYRYNCSDCRAFLSNPNNIYSKPSKCSYNPYTCQW